MFSLYPSSIFFSFQPFFLPSRNFFYATRMIGRHPRITGYRCMLSWLSLFPFHPRFSPIWAQATITYALDKDVKSCCAMHVGVLHTSPLLARPRGFSVPEHDRFSCLMIA